MDRFFRGLLAGISGGIVLDIWGFIVKDLLRIATRNYLDWTSIALYGSLPNTWYEAWYAFGSHLLWSGFLGIAFSYILRNLTSQGFRIKGAMFGFVIGFAIFSCAIALRIPFFAKIPFSTSFTNGIGGILWGTVTAQTLQWLNAKYQ